MGPNQTDKILHSKKKPEKKKKKKTWGKNLQHGRKYLQMM